MTTEAASVEGVLRAVLRIAQAEQRPIESFGVFGSAANKPDANDIDAMLLMADAHESPWTPNMGRLHARVSGDYTVDAPSDPSFHDLSRRIASSAKQDLGIEAWCGLGPIDYGFATRRLHLQGPMGKGGWRSYATKFPIQAWSILLSYRSIVGESPYAGAITAAAIQEYVSTMRLRMSALPSISYARKSVQGLCVVAGVDDSTYESCRRFSVDTGLLAPTELPAEIDESNAVRIGNHALDVLNLIAAEAPDKSAAIRRSTDG